MTWGLEQDSTRRQAQLRREGDGQQVSNFQLGSSIDRSTDSWYEDGGRQTTREEGIGQPCFDHDVQESSCTSDSKLQSVVDN